MIPYRDAPSPLLSIVRDVACQIAKATLEKQMAEDSDFQAQVRQLYADATAKMFAAETRDKLVERLSDTMSSALTKDRY